MILHFQDIEKNYIAHILKEIYIDRVYAPFFQGKTDLTIVDMGANIGLFSLYASQFASKVVAVEPSSQIFEYLKKNTEHDPKISCVQAAIGGENGKLDLYGSDVNLTMFSAHKTGVHNNTPETVKMLGVNTLMGLESLDKIDFLKLDIEGSEFEVLASEEFVKAAPKIDFIMGEIHSWTGRNPQQCVQALEECGYEVSIISRVPLLFLAKRKS